MKRILTTSKRLPAELFSADVLTDVKLLNQLQFIKRYGGPEGAAQLDYAYNLTEYPSRIKKLFIKGGSKKEVPRQVLNIVTNSFTTKPQVFFERHDMEFKEFVTPKKNVTGVVERVQKENARIKKERPQAVAQVEVAETKRARAEVRANRAEVELNNTRITRDDPIGALIASHQKEVDRKRGTVANTRTASAKSDPEDSE